MTRGAPMRGLPALALLVSASFLPTPASAQQESRGGAPAGMVVLTSPPEARVILRGAAEIAGFAPLDLGTQWRGRYSVALDAPGYATSRGGLECSQPGVSPRATSEPPEISGKLLLRSLNFPGAPDLLAGSRGRGAALLIAGVGGVIAVLRDDHQYHSIAKKTDEESQDRASDFQYARERWAIYTGGVWGLSALDYILRPRMRLLESTPTSVTISTPKLRRSGIVWRSLLVPGAGQAFANRRARGVAWLGATLAAGAAFFIADESHHRILTKLERAELRLATASPPEIPALQADVVHFTNRERDSKRLVDGLGLATLGIHAANILDAGLLPLGGHAPGAQKMSLSAPVRRGGVSIAITHRF